MGLLIQVQEQIERAIYEAIRLEIVAQGYLPDISDDIQFPNNAAGKEAFDKAMSDIVDTKGFCIELFSVGGIKARGLKKVPRIVIQKGKFFPGEIGAPPGISQVWDEDNQNFKGVTLPARSSNYYLDIYLVSNMEAQNRVMNDIIGNSISSRKYISLLEDTETRFLLEQNAFSEEADMDEGIVSRIYQYMIPDLYITAPKEVSTSVPITEITLETENPPDSGFTHTTPNP